MVRSAIVYRRMVTKRDDFAGRQNCCHFVETDHKMTYSKGLWLRCTMTANTRIGAFNIAQYRPKIVINQRRCGYASVISRPFKIDYLRNRTKKCSFCPRLSKDVISRVEYRWKCVICIYWRTHMIGLTQYCIERKWYLLLHPGSDYIPWDDILSPRDKYNDA